MKPVSELLRQRDDTLWHVHPEDTVFEALRLLAEYEAGALMVIAGGKLVGVLSERDYTRKVALAGRNSRETRVGDIMTAQVVTVAPATDLQHCLTLMTTRKFRHLPVVDGGVVLGMVSMHDILDDMIADQEATIAQLENYIQS